ncbi:hypothetical protein MBBAR_10c00630 [Methanobrevibacter arboriphilus JCM 13429 = DSM 1125]|uniref:Uncharacterized protein n=1 Tax=Methanobrevibacter arboriphilus JCM 13429 = DSM 1125 TaxID=1300164 RepID=A0A1V6N2A5_METAZ|nr:hypothetical protein [Methanobrevibacter arboriphilus]OQD58722.1 hypothetical protein MBBAR_10c00630 [Methanobrevibacter arboriphilus JCM 13429 = DSM 1125]
MNKKEIIKICKENGFEKIEDDVSIGEVYHIPYETGIVINKMNIASNYIDISKRIWFYFKRGESAPYCTGHINLNEIETFDIEVDSENPT